MRNKKQTPFLDLYREWMEKGERMPREGICGSVMVCMGDMAIWIEPFTLVEPTSDDCDELVNSGLSSYFWGSESDDFNCYQFTPLRQTLILLCAAINGELD